MWEGVEGGWKGVSDVIELVMGESQQGRETRTKALEIKEMMVAALKDGGVIGSSVKAVEDFLCAMFTPKCWSHHSEVVHKLVMAMD